MTNEEFRKLCDNLTDEMDDMIVFGVTKERWDEWNRLNDILKAQVEMNLKENEWKLN